MAHSWQARGLIAEENPKRAVFQGKDMHTFDMNLFGTSFGKRLQAHLSRMERPAATRRERRGKQTRTRLPDVGSHKKPS